MIKNKLNKKIPILFITRKDIIEFIEDSSEFDNLDKIFSIKGLDKIKDSEITEILNINQRTYINFYFYLRKKVARDILMKIKRRIKDND